MSVILDANVKASLLDTYEKLNAEGKIIPESQLEHYYETFRKMFGPERLKTLDGVALLEAIHAHGSANRDSMVYWLEFKDDEEFPTSFFGSIAGGSALKFGIFKSKEKQVWMKGSSTNMQEITEKEAIDIARMHREQMVRGAELLEKLPYNSTAQEYETLQSEMDRYCPNIANSAWGHKYFSLLYPEKLDAYHAHAFQKYHLIKTLILPPKNAGRYTLAYYYASVAKELGVHLNYLIRIMNRRDGRPTRYWRIGTSDGTQSRSHWEEMKQDSCIAIGWADLGDLSDIEHNQEGKETLRALMYEKHYPNSLPTAGKKGYEVLRFAKVIGEGDTVLACDGSTVIGIGKVTGPYYFKSGADFPHRRPVEWLSFKEWPMKQTEGLRTTVYEFKYDENLLEAERTLLNADSVSKVTTDKPANLTGYPAKIGSILERKGQVILYGPPGTGKTYWAEIAAKELAARSWFNTSYEQLTKVQKDEITSADGPVRLCTFHPVYGYEDFMEGYRAETQENQLVFNLRHGIFKKLCTDARNSPERKFYLIIDEINRGDIPRIFGELLTLLEKNKRGKPVVLPLSGKPFWVPENVYVLGTMNTADRSIALLDTALRRRFGFVELMPDIKVLGEQVIEGIPVGQWLAELNIRICEHIGRDARNLQIGHSFFLEGGRAVRGFEHFSRIIQEEIIPLLEEYCYEDYDTLEKLLGSRLVDKQKQLIRHELFLLESKDELVTALLESSPELSASLTTLRSVAAEPAEQDPEEEDDRE